MGWGVRAGCTRSSTRGMVGGYIAWRRTSVRAGRHELAFLPNLYARTTQTHACMLMAPEGWSTPRRRRWPSGRAPTTACRAGKPRGVTACTADRLYVVCHCWRAELRVASLGLAVLPPEDAAALMHPRSSPSTLTQQRKRMHADGALAAGPLPTALARCAVLRCGAGRGSGRWCRGSLPGSCW